MPAFLAAVVVAVVLAFGAASVLEQFQQTATVAYTSPSGVRL